MVQAWDGSALGADVCMERDAARSCHRLDRCNVNGQVRVERFDGGFEVIDETGDAVVELRSAMKSAFAVDSSR